MDNALARTRTCVGIPIVLVRLGIGHKRAHPFPPLALKVPLSGCEPIGGPTFKLVGHNGPWERF